MTAVAFGALGALVITGVLTGGCLSRLTRRAWRLTALLGGIIVLFQGAWLYLVLDGARGWDVVGASAVLTGALVWGFATQARLVRNLVLGLAIALMSLLAVEGLSRLVLDPPPTLPTTEVHPLAKFGRDLLFPNTYRNVADEEVAAGGERPTVLHVGDSMINSGLIERSETMVAELGRRDPTLTHLNLGVPGSGPDYQLVILRRWLDRVPAQRVVLYLFPMNDIGEVGKRFAVCGGLPIVHFDGGKPVEDCRNPGGDPDAWAQLLASPPPFLLTALSPISDVATRLEAILLAARWRWAEAELTDVERWDRSVTLYRAIVELLTARNIPIHLVHMPYLPDLRLEPSLPSVTRTRRDRLKALAAELGLGWSDATAPLRQAIEEHGERAIFPHGPESKPDFHQGPLGHRLLGEWLVRELGMGE